MSNILVISHDVVGAQMAGPGIRYASLSAVLSRQFSVVFAVPAALDEDALIDVDGCIVIYQTGEWGTLAKWVVWADVILLSGDTLIAFPAIEESGRILIIDVYDPHTVETLYLYAQDDSASVRAERARERAVVLAHQCRAGDFYICASEEQRLWWLGILEAYGRVNPYTFSEDQSLRSLIDLVPFGLPSVSCHQLAEPGEIPDVQPKDRVLLWGGGVWQWLDPLTAVKAMPTILQACPDVLLLFPGTRHPNPRVPVAPIVQELADLSAHCGLTDRVRFGDWVPYQSWPSYLLRADVGLSLHPRSLESTLAFRTRVLDYIWAGLPSVVSTGDALSAFVCRHGLGIGVEPGNVAQVAEAVLAILEQPRDEWASRFEQVRTSLTWEQAAQPLISFCEHPHHAPDRLALGGALGNAYYESRLRQCWEERDRLTTTIQGYERGRFIRFMKWLHRILGREAVQ